ncbi:hypothetical protein BIV57_18650 [Mangrovactinospora gilvigrisea]|uniref:ATP-grasp domain-containing protein n=1 Tax=Mangrovactinospora gilvigrisea TaxID=1428644 RepID=A0A1J7C355_9ACTN|nr:hypothetical protein BIV57_18650 [Mangrovactinospora gilvigrisea]
MHHGTLGAIRSLGRAGVEVHAVLEDRGVPAARSRYLRRVYPMGPEPGPVLLGGLLRLGERIGRPTLLVTMDDAGALFAAENAEALRERFLLPVPKDAGLPRRLADKQAVAELCRSWGVPHPRTEAPADALGLRAAVAALGLPLIAKWARPWLLPAAATASAAAPPLRSTQVVRTRAEAEALFARRGEAGTTLLLQELLPESPQGDWFFHGYFDAAGRCLFGATGRKDRSWPPHAGLTALGRWLPNPDIFGLAERLAGGIGYHGVVDLDFRREPGTDRYHLLDFNPRLGAQFRLFADGSGLDVVRAMHLDLTGRRVPAVRPRPGRGFWVENYDPVGALRLMREGELAPAAFVRSLRGVGERAWFAADDPVPFALMWRQLAARGAARALRGRARRRADEEQAPGRVPLEPIAASEGPA